MFLHITGTPFKHESRVIKECRAAFDLGWDQEALVIALWEQGLEEEEHDSGISVWRVVLKSRSWPRNLAVQVLKYLEWLGRIVQRVRSQAVTVIHAHSAAALPIGVVLTWFTGAPLVYDAHELESETNGKSPFRRRMTRWMERLWIKGADRMLVVSDSIADWYAHEYSIRRPDVVRNIPPGPGKTAGTSTVLRDIHEIPDAALLYLYQGALEPGRSVERLLQLFSDLGESRHLVLMGYGSLQSEVTDVAARLSNVHFQPAVPPEQVLSYTVSADVGVCLIENTCLSYYYSLPNKLFEYLMTGLPVLINDMPEQRRIVDEFDCGWVVPASLPDTAALVESIGAGELRLRREGAARAAEAFSWAGEAQKLQSIYREIAA